MGVARLLGAAKLQSATDDDNPRYAAIYKLLNVRFVAIMVNRHWLTHSAMVLIITRTRQGGAMLLIGVRQPFSIY